MAILEGWNFSIESASISENIRPTSLVYTSFKVVFTQLIKQYIIVDAAWQFKKTGIFQLKLHHSVKMPDPRLLFIEP